ncbi:MFS transporter [Halocalculus aciditolerans]|uniref:Putative major facilitator superfamily protein n=1 Tax=Halocalculus aciditolerans TaxID=1383812 RepID=A0A830FDN0_9EURY|nr:MFS transporter [Halocalculus aciditolerans]GGL64873.1 putative major facilitator superfamily protein [Halocalculus aciditolerans]
MSVYRVVTLILGWQVAASVCYYAVFAATPFFRDEFGLGGAAVGLVVTALTLGYAVFLLPLGALTDRFGEHRTLTAGLLGLTVGTALVARADSYLVLLVSVFLLGSVYGTAMPGTNKAIFDRTPPGRQNLAIGVKQVGVTAGSGASALLVTGLASVLYWQAGFYVATAVGVAVALAFWVAYPRGEQTGEASYPDFRRLLANRPYRSLAAAGVCLGAGLFTTTGYTILYVEESVGASVAFGGVVLAALQVSGSVGRVVTGWLSDALPGDPRRRIGAILLVQAVASAALFVVAAFVEGRLAAAATFVVLGFFVLGFTGVYYSCMATVVSAEEMGGATGGGQLALTSGALVAPPVFGHLADTVGYRWSWLLLAGLALVGAGFVVRVILAESTPESAASAE